MTSSLAPRAQRLGRIRQPSRPNGGRVGSPRGRSRQVLTLRGCRSASFPGHIACALPCPGAPGSVRGGSPPGGARGAGRCSADRDLRCVPSSVCVRRRDVPESRSRGHMSPAPHGPDGAAARGRRGRCLLDQGTSRVASEFPAVRYLGNERGVGTTTTSRAVSLEVSRGEIVASSMMMPSRRPSGWRTWGAGPERRTSVTILVRPLGARQSRGLVVETEQERVVVSPSFPQPRGRRSRPVQPWRRTTPRSPRSTHRRGQFID